MDAEICPAPHLTTDSRSSSFHPSSTCTTSTVGPTHFHLHGPVPHDRRFRRQANKPTRSDRQISPTEFRRTHTNAGNPGQQHDRDTVRLGLVPIHYGIKLPVQMAVPTPRSHGTPQDALGLLDPPKDIRPSTTSPSSTCTPNHVVGGIRNAQGVPGGSRHHAESSTGHPNPGGMDGLHQSTTSSTRTSTMHHRRQRSGTPPMEVCEVMKPRRRQFHDGTNSATCTR